MNGNERGQFQKKIYKKTTDKGKTIRFKISRGLTNSEISKSLGVCRSLI